MTPVKIVKGYRYGNLARAAARQDPSLRALPDTRQEEQLSGQVRGQHASDLEERFARALWKHRVSFIFQLPVRTVASLPNQERQVDFLVNGDQPVDIHGYIGHFHSLRQRGQDAFRKLLLDEAFAKMGLKPLLEVPYTRLGSQEAADVFVRRELMR